MMNKKEEDQRTERMQRIQRMFLFNKSLNKRHQRRKKKRLR